MSIITDIDALRQVSAAVSAGEDLQSLCDQLIAELKLWALNGVGLSAIQIGIPKRAFIMAPHGLRYPVIFIANPVITKTRKTKVLVEGCLSLPGVTVAVERPLMITLKGLNRYGVPIKLKLNGFEARVACHEVDHQDGVLIIDHGKPEVAVR